MTKAIYTLGGPGVGKSTLMLDLLVSQNWKFGPYIRFTQREMFGHYLYRPLSQEAAYLGHMRPEFPGTDALSRSVQPHAMTWLEGLGSLDWIFGEGERLGNIAFLSELAVWTDLTVVHLVASEEEMARRRSDRPKQFTTAYARSRTTQARNVARACEAAGILVLEVDAHQHPSEISSAVELALMADMG